MEIKDLQIRQGNVDITVDVVEVSEPREFTKFGTAGKVATATIKDASGECKLSLWNNDVDRIKGGMKIRIQNGYVNEFKGEMQITAGRYGKIDILGESSAGDAPKEKKSPAKAKKEEKKEEEVFTNEESAEEDMLEDVEEELVE